MSNPTALKFGFPHTLVAETGHWWILARPKQLTLGSLVIVCKQPVTGFGQVSAEGFTDLHRVVARAEGLLKGFVAYERINHLMLMMVDPDVHFHVIPRYPGSRQFGALTLADASWPNPPDLAQAQTLPADALAALTAELQQRWQAL